MRIASQIPYLNLLAKHALGKDEIESLIDLFNNAVILIDNKTGKIVLANAKTTELSAYTRAELINQPLDHLLKSNTNSKTNAVITNSNFMGMLINRSGKKIPIQVKTKRLDRHDKWLLLFIEPRTDNRKLHVNTSSSQKKWDSINLLIQAAQHDDVSQAINQILDIGRAILSAETIGLYFQDDKKANRFIRSHIKGQENLLPNTIHNSEFNSAAPDLWIDGANISQTIYQNSKDKNLKYLATTPISQPNSNNGYLIACDPITSPSPEFMGMLSLIGTAVSSIYDQNTQRIKQIIVDQDYDEPNGQPDSLNFDHIMGDLHDGVIILDPDLVVKKANSSAEKIIGYLDSASISQSFEVLAQWTPSIAPALKAAQHGFPSKNLNNIQIRNRNGIASLVNVKVIPVSKNGFVSNITLIINDLSAQEEYKILTEQLENQAFLGEISAIFSHEVRNPINNISTGLQLMSLNLSDDPEASEQINRIKSDLDRLTDLTKSVLSFSGKREYQIKPVDISAILSRIISKFKSKPNLKHIKFIQHFPDFIPTVLGDRRAIEQVFVNIISNGINAIKDESGEITAKIKVPKDMNSISTLEIVISDSGPGIPADVVAHIFEPFYTTKKEGTGLGLAISKRIIEAHKGKIALESFPGGTIFTVHFPLSK